ncbi:hypothetical protein KUTeg_021077 [Tegillarca granosa]|uniref:F-box domain-containing protein n=1 Tax=Tegillarca granosa TaxID=220873 RepID=A0ABQ9EA96_TEGGR|nr:hypothetical protein KUTeg_021077 [Tegillarca granosa]
MNVIGASAFRRHCYKLITCTGTVRSSLKVIPEIRDKNFDLSDNMYTDRKFSIIVVECLSFPSQTDHSRGIQIIVVECLSFPSQIDHSRGMFVISISDTSKSGNVCHFYLIQIIVVECLSFPSQTDHSQGMFVISISDISQSGNVCHFHLRKIIVRECLSFSSQTDHSRGLQIIVEDCLSFPSQTDHSQGMFVISISDISQSGNVCHFYLRQIIVVECLSYPSQTDHSQGMRMFKEEGILVPCFHGYEKMPNHNRQQQNGTENQKKKNMISDTVQNKVSWRDDVSYVSDSPCTSDISSSSGRITSTRRKNLQVEIEKRRSFSRQLYTELKLEDGHIPIATTSHDGRMSSSNDSQSDSRFDTSVFDSDEEVNSHCHCQACCNHEDRVTEPCHNNILCERKLSNDNSQDDTEVCKSPCSVSSWGYFSQRHRNHYKYSRRSDYSSDSDDDIAISLRSSAVMNQVNGTMKQKSHIPLLDSLSNSNNDQNKKNGKKNKTSGKLDIVNNKTCYQKDGVKPSKGCELPQLHLLSVKMGPNLHRGCPPNCQDILAWLPTNLALKVMSFLDPVSLCRASMVCKIWRHLGEEQSFWRKFCCQQKWRLSKAAEHKQVISHMSPEGSIMWKKVFAERFRLRNNWLRGRCTVRTFEGHSQGISCVQFDDSRIVSGSSDKTIKVWNIRTNAQWSVQTLVGHSGTVRCLHLEGNRLVSGSTDKTIKVWDLSTQESWSSIACKVTMIGHTETVRCLQVDDEKAIKDIRLQFYVFILMTQKLSLDHVTKLSRIVSGSLDCNLKFWDIHSGDCINTIDWKAAEGHTGVVRCLQADSWRLVSAADDKTIKVWNLETGQRLVTLRNHTDGVTCLQFNDFIIVSGSYDKTVKLWDFSCC